MLLFFACHDRIHDKFRSDCSGANCIDPDSMLDQRSEEHTSELQSLMRISYAVFCLKKKKKQTETEHSENETINISTTSQYAECTDQLLLMILNTLITTI